MTIGVRLTNSGTSSVATEDETEVTWDTETFDTGDLHSTVSNTERITFPEDGYYMLQARTAFSANSTGRREFYIRKNGTDLLAKAKGTGIWYWRMREVCTIDYFTSGEYVTCSVWQNSGVSLDLSRYSFWAHKLSDSGCKVYNSSTLNTAGTADTVLTFNSEVYDTDDYHSTVSNTGRLVAPSDGKYVIMGCIDWANSADANGGRWAKIKKNEGSYIHISGDRNYNTVAHCYHTIIDLATDDYISIWGRATNAGNLGMLAVNYCSPYVAMHKII